MKIQINRLGKLYSSKVWGIKDINLNLQSGVIGLLGPNGAGKSTLMRLLATVSKPSEGTVTWQNMDIHKQPSKLRDVLGFLPQDFGVYPHLTAHEFLHYIAAAKGLSGSSLSSTIDRLLELVNLTDVRNRKLGGFSGGMKQRVGIAQALLNDPKLLIVDEPTAGLDPEERVRFRNLITELAGDRIVMLSSHIVSDIEAAATSIAIIKKGNLICHTSPEAIIKSVAGKVWELSVASAEIQQLKNKFNVTSTQRTSEGIKVRIVSREKPSSQATAVTANLEDAYLYILNNGVQNQ